MSDKRPKLQRVTTPRGTFKYPRLIEPDTKFDADGVFKVTLILSEEDSEDLRATLDAAMEASFEQAKKDNPKKAKKIKMADAPYSEELDEDGNETGNWEFRFKLSAVGKDRKSGRTWKNRVMIFDGKRTPIKKGISVWGGTEGKVSFDISPFFTDLIGAGISLRLRAVQIIKLVSGGDSDDPDQYGFDEDVEDGYEFDENDVTDQDYTATESDDTAGDDEDDDPDF